MTEPATPPEHLRRSLSNRHLQLIAIGGAIGTGLFMGSGKTISLAGPSIVFVYLIIGAMLTNPSSISPPTCSVPGPASSADGRTGSAGS
ncbi:hypothetical protein G6F31_018674 [Rhizopus arrhizus]|nr:hypothetical protein G6F31_018674 [Rhizopus arrhizus]